MNDHTGWSRPNTIISPLAARLFFDQFKPYIATETSIVTEGDGFRISFMTVRAFRQDPPRTSINMSEEMLHQAHRLVSPDTQPPLLVDSINLDGVHALNWFLGAWYDAAFGVEYGPTAISWLPPRRSFAPSSSRR
jgi:hypothetical protein